MKKVLFITNKLIGGGSERVLTTLAEKFSEVNDYQVSIISYKNDSSYSSKENIKIYTLENHKKKFSRILEIRKIIKKINPNYIISFEFFVNMQVCISDFNLKNKLIISERNDPAKRGNNYKYIRNILYRLADVLVCQTPDAKQYFPKYIQKKAIIIPNPLIDGLPNRYQGKRNKEIVTFCRIEKQKNLKLMIDAFENISKKKQEYTLHIYGEGNQKLELIEYVAKKNLDHKIIFHNFDKNIHKKILKSAIYISTSDYEGLSNSMLEAMAIGLPVICTDCPCGGARMVIKNGENGILIPVGDRNALEDAIFNIINNEEKMKKLSKNATKIKNILNIDQIYEEWKKILN